MHAAILLQRPAVPRLVKKLQLLALNETRMFITAFTPAHHFSEPD